MPPIQRDTPYSSKSFQLIVNGISDDGAAVSAGFSDISGLNVTIVPIEYRNGNEDTTVHKLPGLKTFTNLVCKRGATGHPQFWVWIKNALEGNIQKAEGSVILQDENKQEVMRWNFSNGWPVKYTGPTFSSTKPDTAFESIEIAIEDLALDV